MRALATPAAAVRPFHIGPSSSTSRLLRDERDRAASAEATEDRVTEFKKMRQKTLGEAGEKELFSQTHPRLKSREDRMSIAKFRTNWLNQDPPNSSKYVTLDGTLFHHLSQRRGPALVLMRDKVASSRFVSTVTSSSSSPWSTTGRRSRA